MTKVVSVLVIGLLASAPAAAWAQAAPPDPPAPPAAPVDTPAGPPITAGGRVVTTTGVPVGGAVITVPGTDVRATTDALGRFTVEVPVGTDLVVEAAGLETQGWTVAGPALGDVVMFRSDTVLETVDISAEAPARTPGAATLDRGELQRVPGAGGDIVKALTVMPGVVNLQVPLGYSGVVIRGASPQDSKVLIDDFEVPVLFHNIGFRAVVPADAIASLEFIPGGYDVAYGRASSGIVALTTRGGADRGSTQAEVSMIDGGLLAQGPLGAHTRYMLGLRRSTIDFILPSIIPDSVDLSLTTVPSYYDGQFRLDHQLRAHWRLSLSALGADDTFELYATKDDDQASKRYFNRTRFLRVTAAAKYYDGPWSANLALSGLLPQFVFEAGLYQAIDVRQPTLTPRAEVTRSYEKLAGLTNAVWRLGGEIQVGRNAVDLALPIEQREGEPPPAYDPKDTTEQAHEVIWNHDYAAWTALAANLDPKIRLTGGLRAEVFGRIGELALQPRGELAVKLAAPWTARLSAGAYRRPPEYQSENLADDVKSERSAQTILGLQYEPREGIRVQGSVYYIDRSHLITHAGMTGALVNDGHGTTDGAELLATYRGGPWFGWLSYSYSHSTRVDHPGEPARLFTFDQPHSVNAAASWKHGRWQLGGRWQLYSGLPYTPVMGSVFDSDRNLYLPRYDEVNSARAPIHHQLDLRVDYTHGAGPIALTGFIDVQNVYMNDSVVTYIYSYDYSQRTAFRSLPIIPSLGLRGVW